MAASALPHPVRHRVREGTICLLHRCLLALSYRSKHPSMGNPTLRRKVNENGPPRAKFLENRLGRETAKRTTKPIAWTAAPLLFAAAVQTAVHVWFEKKEKKARRGAAREKHSFVLKPRKRTGIQKKRRPEAHLAASRESAPASFAKNTLVRDDLLLHIQHILEDLRDLFEGRPRLELGHGGLPARDLPL